jgi:uncharacterized protein (DUF2235 family)
MGKNIVILSDGTGQRGGLVFDERRSNIYKLYRATRCGPDSCMDPTEQLAYYDPGIGTLPGGLGFLGAVGRKIYNMVSQATGLGLTANIIDCYAAIVSLWQRENRISSSGSVVARISSVKAQLIARRGILPKWQNGKSSITTEISIEVLPNQSWFLDRQACGTLLCM